MTNAATCLVILCSPVGWAPLAQEPQRADQPADVRAALDAVRAAHSVLRPLVVECDIAVDHSGSPEEIRAGLTARGLTVIHDAQSSADLTVTSRETATFDGRDTWRVETESLMKIGPRDINVTVTLDSPRLSCSAPSLRPATARVVTGPSASLGDSVQARRNRYTNWSQEAALKGYQTTVLWATGLLDRAADATVETVHEPGRDEWQRIFSEELGLQLEFDPATGEVGTFGIFMAGKPGFWSLYFYEGHSGPALFPARHPSAVDGQRRAADGTPLCGRKGGRYYRSVRPLASSPDPKLFDPAALGSDFMNTATRQPSDATGAPLDQRPAVIAKSPEQVSRDFQAARAATPFTLTLARSIAGAALIVGAIVWWRSRRG